MTPGPPVDYMRQTAEQYGALGYSPYRWVCNRDVPPWTPLRGPVSRSRLALVASGGIYAAGQVAFHFRDDTSLRIIDTGLPTDELRVTHFAYDLEAARSDPNVVFPLDPLRELAAEGVLGSLSPRAYTFMGGIYSARKVREQVAPAVAERLLADEVDLALLVPV